MRDGSQNAPDFKAVGVTKSNNCVHFGDHWIKSINRWCQLSKSHKICTEWIFHQILFGIFITEINLQWLKRLVYFRIDVGLRL